MTRYLKLAGITKAYSPHSLRHYAASRVMPSRGVWHIKKSLFSRACAVNRPMRMRHNFRVF
jgi:hypothetical protein